MRAPRSSPVSVGLDKTIAKVLSCIVRGAFLAIRVRREAKGHGGLSAADVGL